ncbi:MAG: hypothetical protein DMF62_11070 [Acidobacteria bacterium]|nr:MAG: hypothetical protein DMF62_11070 [Acidobacteriota bacterium]PYS99934.1 MAG: hypothetical protein DMF63_09350 [Acidobacteriota bacterium]
MNEIKSAEETITSATRQYTFWQILKTGFWIVKSRPINPATGKGWRGSRSLIEGHNAYELFAHDGSRTGIIAGQVPADWDASGKYFAAYTYFQTRADALAAIAAGK